MEESLSLKIHPWETFNLHACQQTTISVNSSSEAVEKKVTKQSVSRSGKDHVKATVNLLLLSSPIHRSGRGSQVQNLQQPGKNKNQHVLKYFFLKI